MDVTAICERAGSWWAVTIPEVEGAFTQARRLDQVPAMAADAVALLANVDATNVKVRVEVKGFDASRGHWAHAREESNRAAAIARNAAEEAKQVVTELRDQGMTVREVACLLDISPQRVSQIASRKAEEVRQLQDA
jgi:DNA-directed RNA polymerase specialized sigma subunit